MYKKIASFLFITVLSGNIVAMAPDKPASDQTIQSNNQLEIAKTAVDKELKKNKAEFKKFKDNAVLAPAIAKVEPTLHKIVTSEQFKAIIEEITTKQAQEITAGKTFQDVKYEHSLSTAFPKLANPNKLFAKIYAFIANIEHYQLLLTKLNSPQPVEEKSSEQDSTKEAPAKATTEDVK